MRQFRILPIHKMYDMVVNMADPKMTKNVSIGNCLVSHHGVLDGIDGCGSAC